MSESIGQRLRRLRLERGLTQRSLAAGGVSHAHISRIESGSRAASVKALRVLAGRLGVTSDHLEFGEPEPGPDELSSLLAARCRPSARGATYWVRHVPGEPLRLTWATGEGPPTSVEADSLSEALRLAVRS